MAARNHSLRLELSPGDSRVDIVRIVRIAVRVALVFLALMLARPAPLAACSCSSPTICDLMRARVIFIGEVIDGGITTIRQDPWYTSSGMVRLRVVERFHGLPKNQETVDIVLHQSPGMCAPNPYHHGKKYLVTPYLSKGTFHDGPCFNGSDVARFAEGVEQIRRYFAGKVPTSVRGRVAATRHDDDMVPSLLSDGEAKPIAGVRVSASRAGKRYSAVTDSDGRYDLRLPGAGAYGLEAILEPYTATQARIEVPARGCTVHDFALKINNTISGRVFDESGQAVDTGRVGLIDIERAPPDPERRTVFLDEYVGRDATYQFRNVPLGRYLLVFNPEGPRSGRASDLPFESTYHPAARTPANARVVEVKAGGVHLTDVNLVVGKKVEFRQVSVRVRFSDGAPMKTGEVLCTGLPLEEGAPPWTQREYVAKFAFLRKADDAAVEFLVPTNRKFRLEVRDAYGRDLKGDYASWHEPGTDPVVQEFIVVP